MARHRWSGGQADAEVVTPRLACQQPVEQRVDLKKLLTSLRLAVAKTSAPEKNDLVKKLERITR